MELLTQSRILLLQGTYEHLFLRTHMAQCQDKGLNGRPTDSPTLMAASRELRALWLEEPSRMKLPCEAEEQSHPAHSHEYVDQAVAVAGKEVAKEQTLHEPQVVHAALTAKVPIPHKEYPHVNFLGLLIGPRGKTLANLEKETSCKLLIRGRGSVKAGRGRVVGHDGVEGEPLHCLVQASCPRHLKRGVGKVKQLLRNAVDDPNCEFELKKQQLRELMIGTGTLTRTNGATMSCKLCGKAEHRSWECSDTNQTSDPATRVQRCGMCGASDHRAVSCLSSLSQAELEREYLAFMTELGISVPSQQQ
eukprot:m.261204 g.261204  ORF g.261204 m.261204 type:complete len:305 (+) comp15575_c1_seq8:108-1022(+)